MHRFMLTTAAALACAATPAKAQETATIAATEAASDVGTAQDNPVPSWAVTLSGGGSVRADGPDGSWQSAALEKTVGRGYLRAGVMRYHGTLVQSDSALPSDYYVGTIGGGGNFSGWVADAWASFGKQVYGNITDSAGSRPSNGARSSTYLALGGDFGRVVPLARNLYLTPTVAASYASGKLLRPQRTNSDYPDLETAEPTWSANLAARLDRSFGKNAQNYVGLTVSHNWTSNGVSNVNILETNENSAAIGIDSEHLSDQWTELGATASLSLTPRLRMDLIATRGLGVLAGDFTNLGLSLRRSF